MLLISFKYKVELNRKEKKKLELSLPSEGRLGSPAHPQPIRLWEESVPRVQEERVKPEKHWSLPCVEQRSCFLDVYSWRTLSWLVLHATLCPLPVVETTSAWPGGCICFGNHTAAAHATLATTVCTKVVLWPLPCAGHGCPNGDIVSYNQPEESWGSLEPRDV